MTEQMMGATQVSFPAVVGRASKLGCRGERSILRITGAPGTGTTTLANALVDALRDAAVLVAIDGSPLTNKVLIERNARDREGAPDTFDIGGYIALLKRLRSQTDDVYHAAQSDHAADASSESALPVNKSTPLVTREGNYLLLQNCGWEHVRSLHDQTWPIVAADGLRQQRPILLAQGLWADRCASTRMGARHRRTQYTIGLSNLGCGRYFRAHGRCSARHHLRGNTL